MKELTQQDQYQLMRVMAHRTTVASVCSDRGQTHWCRRDQKGALVRQESRGKRSAKGSENWRQERASSQGHALAATAIGGLLAEMGFSLKANKKTIEGTGHGDRDAQFQHINRMGKAYAAKGKPVISVDWKKKELMGNAQE